MASIAWKPENYGVDNPHVVMKVGPDSFGVYHADLTTGIIQSVGRPYGLTFSQAVADAERANG